MGLNKSQPEGGILVNKSGRKGGMAVNINNCRRTPRSDLDWPSESSPYGKDGGFNRSSQNPRFYAPTGGRWRCEDPLERG